MPAGYASHLAIALSYVHTTTGAPLGSVSTAESYNSCRDCNFLSVCTTIGPKQVLKRHRYSGHRLCAELPTLSLNDICFDSLQHAAECGLHCFRANMHVLDTLLQQLFVAVWVSK